MKAGKVAPGVSAMCIDRGSTIRQALGRMDRLRRGIILVVDRSRRLVGTITDGDIRRCVLARMSLELPVTAILARKSGVFRRPITARAGAPREKYLAILKKHRVLHLPLLDAKGRVADLVLMSEFAAEPLAYRAVVMAGGKGSRLFPLTKDTPKPMLRVGGKPVMEIIIDQLRDAGIKQVQVSTHFLRDRISSHFGDGRAFGVDLSYVDETKPLGTAGALGLLKRPTETLLVINGDVLTQVDFRAMMAYHRELKADLTVAVSRYDLKVPYGVVESDGHWVKGVTEKPTLQFFVSAGIYLIEPAAFKHIRRGQRCDMTQLIERLTKARRPVASFPIHEYWLDIGQPKDFAKAQKKAASWTKTS